MVEEKGRVRLPPLSGTKLVEQFGHPLQRLFSGLLFYLSLNSKEQKLGLMLGLSLKLWVGATVRPQ